MRKTVLVLLMALIATPAIAVVDITCTTSGNEVTISYDASGETEKVRAFALDIEVYGATITSIDAGDPNVKDYYVYMGSIVIDVNGNIGDYGSPVAPASDPGAKGAIGTSGITIEMGSLYDPCDPLHQTAPPASGELCKIYVSSSVRYTVTITPEETFRGGVVLEDGSVATVNAPGCVLDTYPTLCWSIVHCPGQLLGDATCDGKVNIMDILKVKQSWLDSTGDPTYNCCADFDMGGMVNIMDVLKVKQNWLASGLGGDLTVTCP